MEPASYLEFKRAIKEISNLIIGARILKLYHMKDGSIVLRLRSDSFSGELRIIPGMFFYLVEGGYEKPTEISQIGKIMRKIVENMRIVGAGLIEGERILVLKLEGRQRLKLVCEFLPKGTILILDEADKILACLHKLEMRDRRLAPGEQYKFPPRGPAPSIETIEDILGKKRALKKKVVSILASEAGLGGRYAEEVLYLAGVDLSMKIEELSTDDHARILEAVRSVFEMIENGQPVIASSNDGDIQPLPYPMKIYELKGWRFESAESLNEAFRVAYERYLAGLIEQEMRRNVEEKLRDLRKKSDERRLKAEQLSIRASNLRKVAEKLFQLSAQIELMKGRPGEHELMDMRMIVDDKGGKLVVSYDGVEVELRLEEPITRQASSLFDEAKKVMSAAEKLRAEAEELEKRIERFKGAIQRSLEEASLKVSARIKPSKSRWYEKYRWFITSEGFLVVAGKDVSSNTALLKKHLEPDDLVFHAEVRGAAVVILKNGKNAGEASKNEAAQFAATYSKAWKEGLRTITVYYVEPGQISFEPPPGHYIPKGGFIVKGERHYLQVKLELVVGITSGLELIYGPPTAIAGKARSHVKLKPGNRQAEELADTILMILKRAFADIELDPKAMRDLREQIKEIIPYGRGDIAKDS